MDFLLDEAPPFGALSRWRVEVLMLWPDDAGRRAEVNGRVDRFKAACDMAGETVAGLSDDDEITMRVRDLKALVREAQEAKGLESDIADAFKLVNDGGLVGAVFLELVDRHLHKPRVATKGQALAWLNANRRKDAKPVSKSTLDNRLWPRYAAVAHLWAAALLYKAVPTQQLAEFLAVAERLRMAGLSIKNNRGALLADGEGWAVPPVLDLPEPPQVDILAKGVFSSSV